MSLARPSLHFSSCYVLRHNVSTGFVDLAFATASLHTARLDQIRTDNKFPGQLLS